MRRLWTNHARVGAAVLLLALVTQAQAANTDPKDGNFKASDGINIHYLTAGDSGSWVVLVHGFSDSARRMWFTTGIAPALAKNHRVVAIDNRNHGQSDKPEPGASGRWQDTLELMDHLKIDTAHIHGYSMGGGITGSLLAANPERFITAGFGGSGIAEVDNDLRAKAMELDRAQADPAEAKRENDRWSRILATNPRALAQRQERAKAAEEAEKSGGLKAVAELESAARPAPKIDLTKIAFPVLGVNGSLDSPHAKTQRMSRELKNFTGVVVPDKTHLTLIGVGGPVSPLFVETVVEFINANDPK